MKKTIWPRLLVLLVALTLISSLKIINLLSELEKTKTGDVSVYDQDQMPWTAEEREGILELTEVVSASDEDIERINPENVFTAECGYIIQKPEEVTLTCADGGISVQDIKWDIWRASGASGSGIHTVNQCKPDCVTGKWIEVPVEVKLTRLMTDGDKFYLTSFNAYSLDEKVLDLGWSYPWEFEKILLAEDGSIATPFLD